MSARSLIERAVEAYGWDPRAPDTQSSRKGAPEPPTVFPIERSGRSVRTIDFDALRARGFLTPDHPTDALAEEMRIVKRQLLLNASGAATGTPLDRGRMILVCSAQPDEGKTFCAINLALSLASERDTEVLLVDADFAKPDVLSTLGLSADGGLMDVLADPSLDVEDLIVATDIPKLHVLGAGAATRDDTELLASARTREVLDALHRDHPDRIVILDSAPALAASPASVLALNVGQILMVVRADCTTDAELRDALQMLEGCSSISLLLNATSFFGQRRRFGSYYGRST